MALAFCAFKVSVLTLSHAVVSSVTVSTHMSFCVHFVMLVIHLARQLVLSTKFYNRTWLAAL